MPVTLAEIQGMLDDQLEEIRARPKFTPDDEFEQIRLQAEAAQKNLSVKFYCALCRCPIRPGFTKGCPNPGCKARRR